MESRDWLRGGGLPHLSGIGFQSGSCNRDEPLWERSCGSMARPRDLGRNGDPRYPYEAQSRVSNWKKTSSTC